MLKFFLNLVDDCFFVLFHFYPSHEKATVALYFGRIRTRLGIGDFLKFFKLCLLTV